MRRLEPHEFDLFDTIPLWVRPGEDMYTVADFEDRDMSTQTFSLEYEEYLYPHRPSAYDILAPGTIAHGSFDVSEAADGIIRLVISRGSLELWQDRRMRLRLVVTESDGRVWVAMDRTLHVEDGA